MCSLSLHFQTYAILVIYTKSITKMPTKKNCRYAVAGVQNWTLHFHISQSDSNSDPLRKKWDPKSLVYFLIWILTDPYPDLTDSCGSLILKACSRCFLIFLKYLLPSLMMEVQRFSSAATFILLEKKVPIADMQLRCNISLKSCRIEVADC